jgi:hypothetical protein
MPDLRDRIEAALKTKELDPRDFEQCAVQSLTSVYPGLSPVTGGADLGRDADLGPLLDGPRLLATIGPPGANLHRGLASMKKQGVSCRNGVVLATTRVVSGTSRKNLKAAARKAGTKLVQVYDRSWLAGLLLKDGYWRRRLLEVTSEPAALVAVPIELRRYGEDLPLIGRNAMLRTIDTSRDDLVILGPPGMGKTRVLAEAQRVAFLELAPDARRLGEDLDELAPALVVVEDAARRPDDLRLLQRMRSEESHRKFRIAATAWLDEAEAVHERLDRGVPLKVDLLERPEMDRILGQLGINNYWLRAGILDQAAGRPGWAVVLARTAVDGKPISIFDGQALARQVERYLEVAGESERRRRVLAHVALYDGVAEEDLGVLADRLGMVLPDLTRVLHASTHNGILERHLGNWRVRPDALRIALIDRWFLASDALEPMTALLRKYPAEELTLVTACLEAALRGSPRGAEIARLRAPRLTQGIVKGDAAALQILRLYSELDEASARWAITDRVEPALSRRRLPGSSRHFLHTVIESAVDRYQIAPAVKILLDEALRADGGVNAVGHPVRILSESAVRILPEVRPDAQRRSKIFAAALEWLDSDPSPRRWDVFAQLCKSVLSPFTAGTWNDPGKPMTFIFAQGIDQPATLARIANELWPAVEARLARAPNAAIVYIGELANDWLVTSHGGGPLDFKASQEQAEAALALAARMVKALEIRSEPSVGLAVRFARLFGSPPEATLDPDFLLVSHNGIGSAGWPAHQQNLRALAGRWKDDGPARVMRRLKKWEEQLRLAGPGLSYEQHVIGMVGEEVANPEPWAREAVRQGVLAGAAIFHAALQKRAGQRVPRWFTDALAKPILRPHALSAALRPRVPDAIADYALRTLDKGDARSISAGLIEREAADRVVSALLRHAVPEVRGLAAVDIEPPDTRRMTLGERDQKAWMKAIANCQPEHLSAGSGYGLGRALEFLAQHRPRLTADWFKRRLDISNRRTYLDAIPQECQGALAALPNAEKLRLLIATPKHWRQQLFSEGLAGTDPRWVLEAVDAGTLSVADASNVLDEVPRETYDRVAPELVRRGLDPAHALASLEATGWSGDESKFYAQLLARCEEYVGSDDHALVSIGKIGVPRYSHLRDLALEGEHIERVFAT